MNQQKKSIHSLQQVAAPCMDDHLIPPQDYETTRGALFRMCSDSSVKCLYFGKTWTTRLIYGQLSTLARAETTWNNAGDKRLLSYINHIYQTKLSDHSVTWEIRVKMANLVSSKMLHLQVTCGIQKSTSGGLVCLFGSHTFAPISWMCKKQTAVSHSSAESEIILLDAGITCGWHTSSPVRGVCLGNIVQ